LAYHRASEPSMPIPIWPFFGFSTLRVATIGNLR
jgi:hypothetical protein